MCKDSDAVVLPLNCSFSDKLIRILQQMTKAKIKCYAESLAMVRVCMVLHRSAVCDSYFTDLINMRIYYQATQRLAEVVSPDALPENFTHLDQRMQIAALATKWDCDFRADHISEAMELIVNIRTFWMKVHELSDELIQEAWIQDPPTGPFDTRFPWHQPLIELVDELRCSGKVSDWQDIEARPLERLQESTPST